MPAANREAARDANLPDPAALSDASTGSDPSESVGWLVSEVSRVHFELAVDVAGIGRFDWDLTTDTLRWDDRLKRLIEVDPDVVPTVQEMSSRILPSDLPAVEQATRAAITGGNDMHVDFRIVDPAGATRWLTASARGLSGPDGAAVRLLGVVYDSSLVHADREQAARALDTMATAYGAVDRDWTIRYLNQAARRLINSPIELVGLSVWDTIPGLSNPAVSALVHAVMDGQEPTTLEMPSTSTGRWFEISVQPVANGIAALISDVTARREAQQEAARAADRVSLLAQAGSTLVQRRPLHQTVEAGLDLLVPHLAFAATVYLHEGQGRGLKLVGTRHDDPQLQADLLRFFDGLPISATDPNTPTGRAVLTGTTQVIGPMDEEFVNSATPDPALRARLLSLQETGVVAVPMVSRGESIGLIGLLGLHGRSPTGPDLVLIEDIGSRIASAIDNAQILIQVQQARQTAELVTKRLEFLASVADALGSTLDADQVSRRLSRMLVPSLATMSMVTLLDEDGRVDQIYATHEDATQQKALEEYAAARRAALLDDPSTLTKIVEMAQPLIQLDVAEVTEQILQGEAGASALRRLAPAYLTALPIMSRERALGVISLYTSAERGSLSDLDRSSAREVARRAGLVLDNARLYARLPIDGRHAPAQPADRARQRE